ncbi:hypothetical protein EZS27_026893 [termite gut metagenome]|uniref:DUF4062 domain-containing protein n=1 Tax=termite gut metagenome TaxID=433724 RepID=A0A5J4QRT4_9ZZZZ
MNKIYLYKKIIIKNNIMAKPKIFISSTFYDLKQIRSDIDSFIESLGYDAIRNEEGDIPYNRDVPLENSCCKEIQSVDILVSIIGGRFGTESKRNSSSISQTELRTALDANKQVYIFIEKSVLTEYEIYLLNKENNEMAYRYVDDKRIHQFIEEIKNLNVNNNIKGFETASDITKYLKEQFAGLFQRFLEEQTKIKEINLIDRLDRTAKTLDKLVTYLSDENKDKAEEVNKILMINHPLIESLRTSLKIPYNFYIIGFDDLKCLLDARGFIINDTLPWNFDFIWIKHFENKNKRWVLTISTTLFDNENRLKFFKKQDWDECWVTFKEETVRTTDDDDLPF